jgi:hypothetical protein
MVRFFGGETPRETIAKVAANDPKITKLSFTNNAMIQMKSYDYCVLIAEALKTNTHVTSVSLIKCGVTDVDCQVLAEVLEVSKTLEEMHLDGNRIQSFGATCIAEGLEYNTTLKLINLLNQPENFGEACLDAWLNMFDTNYTLTQVKWRLDSRKSFALNKCITRNKDLKRRGAPIPTFVKGEARAAPAPAGGGKFDLDAAPAPAPAPAPESAPSPEPAPMSVKDRVGAATAQVSATAPEPGARRKSVTKMTFGVTPKETIAKVAANDESITSVTFNNNATIQMKSHDYMVLLTEALKTNTHVKKVSIIKCGITDVDLAVLAAVLEVNSTLVELDLDGNSIKGEGAVAIAAALEYNTTLKMVSFLNQPGVFGEGCLDAFVKMFDTNYTLIDIKWRLDSRKAFILTKCLTRNKDLFKRGGTIPTFAKPGTEAAAATPTTATPESKSMQISVRHSLHPDTPASESAPATEASAPASVPEEASEAASTAAEAEPSSSEPEAVSPAVAAALSPQRKSQRKSQLDAFMAVNPPKSAERRESGMRKTSRISTVEMAELHEQLQSLYDRCVDSRSLIRCTSFSCVCVALRGSAVREDSRVAI